MKILQTVKYYSPSKGGMESVVQDIVSGVLGETKENIFTVYGNSHFPIYKRRIVKNQNLSIVKEVTPLIFKSQPLTFKYSLLKNLLKETDIIHHHYPFPNMEMALLRYKDILSKKKLIITWHANIKNSRWSWIGKYYNPIIRKILNRARYIVVTSPQLLEYSEILQEYADKVRVIPLSFDPRFSEFSRQRKYPLNRKFRLLFVGKLRTYKGLMFLLNAISDLDVELTIVGEGENEKQLMDQVLAYGIKNKVRFLKGINADELIKIYQESDVFVLPSINEAEAFGVVQLEAMANGLPVINTNLKSGVPFVSLDNITGITVEPQNSVALKNAINQLLSNPDTYEAYSKNAIKRSKEFSRESMAISYLKLYND